MKSGLDKHSYLHLEGTQTIEIPVQMNFDETDFNTAISKWRIRGISYVEFLEIRNGNKPDKIIEVGNSANLRYARSFFEDDLFPRLLNDKARKDETILNSNDGCFSWGVCDLDNTFVKA